jgi:hypothetical protein
VFDIFGTGIKKRNSSTLNTLSSSLLDEKEEGSKERKEERNEKWDSVDMIGNEDKVITQEGIVAHMRGTYRLTCVRSKDANPR